MLPILLFVFQDLVTLLFALLVVGVPAAGLSLLLGRVAAVWPGWLVAGLIPVWFGLFLLGLCTMAAVVRLALPRLKAGSYPFRSGPMALAWSLHTSLRRILSLPLWSPLLVAQPLLRFISFRALGARVSYNMQTAANALVVDPSLVRVGSGAMLAGDSLIAGHSIENGRLLLGEVDLGEGVQVLGGVKISPDVVVGAHSIIGPDSRIAPNVRIGNNAHLGIGCTLNSGVRIGADAVLGHRVVLDANVELGEGAVVPSFAHVPKGTRVPAGERFKPGPIN